MSIQEVEESGVQRYLGKYRGTVINNIDPLKKGRLQVIVPDVDIAPSTWAMPCFPVAALQMGAFFVPLPGAGVWVEFEQGDPDYPIWVGGWWGSAAEMPVSAVPITPGVPAMAMLTPLQSGMIVSDGPVAAPMPFTMPTGGVQLRSGASSITIDAVGVAINAPKVEINGITIIMNRGALTVI